MTHRLQTRDSYLNSESSERGEIQSACLNFELEFDINKAIYLPLLVHLRKTRLLLLDGFSLIIFRGNLFNFVRNSYGSWCCKSLTRSCQPNVMYRG